MPKIELHLHLEGAFTFEFLFGLIQKYGGDPGIMTIQDLQNKFVFKDFSHFIETWFWKNKYFRRPEDFEASTFYTLENLHRQNVIYCEVFFSPWDFTSSGLKVEEIAEATIAGKVKAENEFGIRCNLIADIVRDYGAGGAINRLKQITPFLNKGVIGLGLGGSEQKYPAQDFAAVYHEARKLGFHLTAHAGEAAGPESVWAAVEQLGVERIGHGVRAVEDTRLVEVLKQKQIPLEICITSNLKTQIYPTAEAHPFKYLFEQGLRVTLNSDDPTMFGATITDEFLLAHEQLHFSLDDLQKLTGNAIQAAFIPTVLKSDLNRKIETYWQSIK